LKQTSSFQGSKDTKHKILPPSFYRRGDVVQIARELLGKVLVSKTGHELTAGIICETEAYAGITDKASHAYSYLRTNRTEIMYHKGGLSYVYLCYGIHHLFNVVCNEIDVPHAVLIRNIKPLEGLETMIKRRGRKSDENLITGPGTVSQALNIKVAHNSQSL